MSNSYQPQFMAEAYDSLVKSLKDELKKARKKEDEETYKQVAINDVIFPFVLQHCGRNKVIELGKLIDEMLKKEYGKDEGFEDLASNYELT